MYNAAVQGYLLLFMEPYMASSQRPKFIHALETGLWTLPNRVLWRSDLVVPISNSSILCLSLDYPVATDLLFLVLSSFLSFFQ